MDRTPCKNKALPFVRRLCHGRNWFDHLRLYGKGCPSYDSCPVVNIVVVQCGLGLDNQNVKNIASLRGRIFSECSLPCVTMSSRIVIVGYLCPSSLAILYSQLLFSQSGIKFSSPSLYLLPQTTSRRKPHHESKKAIARMTVATNVTAIMLIPMTFHPPAALGGVVDSSGVI